MAGFEGSLHLPAPADQRSWPALHSIDFRQASFEQLVGLAEQLGANRGVPAVIELYRNWIAVQSGGCKYLYAAWFNLGVELSCAGDRNGAILAYRTALAISPDFSLAAINLGLVLERGGETEAALATWTARDADRRGAHRPDQPPGAPAGRRRAAGGGGGAHACQPADHALPARRDPALGPYPPENVCLADPDRHACPGFRRPSWPNIAGHSPHWRCSIPWPSRPRSGEGWIARKTSEAGACARPARGLRA